MNGLARFAVFAAGVGCLVIAFGQTPSADADKSARAKAQAIESAEPTVRPDAPQASPAPAATKPGSKPAAGKPAATKPSTGARNAPATDKLDLETTQITGNRELPKVMVVVPWKRSDIGDLVGRPVNSLVDEALQPVDREVFRREIDYYGALSPDKPRDETHVTAGKPDERPEK